MDAPALFQCDRQPGSLTLSRAACCAFYLRSAHADPWDAAWHCRGCPVGAQHAGVETGPPKPRSCVRCGAGGTKIVGRLLCVPCYNRQAEWVKGRNGKGTPPVDYQIPAVWTDTDATRIVLARTAEEAAAAYGRLYGDPLPALVDSGVATPAEGAEWWDEVKRLSLAALTKQKP